VTLQASSLQEDFVHRRGAEVAEKKKSSDSKEPRTQVPQAKSSAECSAFLASFRRLLCDLCDSAVQINLQIVAPRENQELSDGDARPTAELRLADAVHRRDAEVAEKKKSSDVNQGRAPKSPA